MVDVSIESIIDTGERFAQQRSMSESWHRNYRAGSSITIDTDSIRPGPDDWIATIHSRDPDARKILIFLSGSGVAHRLRNLGTWRETRRH